MPHTGSFDLVAMVVSFPTVLLDDPLAGKSLEPSSGFHAARRRPSCSGVTLSPRPARMCPRAHPARTAVRREAAHGRARGGTYGREDVVEVRSAAGAARHQE